jgi:leader peptidase (prepilin peptidase)/N-methyltransferase
VKFLLLFIIIMGLLIGSFLNVVIYRLPREESIVWPGSHCSTCGHSLQSLDLIPVLSYLFLRGQCRYCGDKISTRYPLVEILTALLFAIIYLRFGWSVWTLAGCLLTAILISTALIDLDTGFIPDVITYPGMLIGIIISYYTLGFLPSLYGMLALSGTYLIILLLSRGGLGGGDVKLAGVIGAFTGIEGAFLTFIISSLLGGLWAVILLATQKAGLKTAIRFGPFLAVAAYIAYVWGQEILFYYWQLF